MLLLKLLRPLLLLQKKVVFTKKSKLNSSKVLNRMDVKINNTLSLAPFVQYFMAQDRQSSAYGSNLMIGVSVAYSDLFNL